MDFYQNKSGETVKSNLTALTWAHAVNSQKQLTDALNSDINFIEADVVMGKIKNTGTDLPIMAHPPAKSSDLSLDSFLLQIKGHNENNGEKMKGVKLDFKSIEVFEDSLQTLKDTIPEMKNPIWLNADIIEGPVVNQILPKTRPVNPEQFFAGCAQFEKAVLSIGWTTNWTSSISNGFYTRKMTNAMLEAIRYNNVTQSITLPVRAGIAANSFNELHDLVKTINETNECSLTIWSSQNDFVNIEKLRKLIFSFGFDRVYLDVPKDLSDQLNLSRSDGASSNNNQNKNESAVSLSTFLNFSIISIGMVLISLWLQKVHI